jgi:hypothetical protein
MSFCHSNVLKKLPKFVFLVSNMPAGNPVETMTRAEEYTLIVFRCALTSTAASLAVCFQMLALYIGISGITHVGHEIAEDVAKVSQHFFRPDVNSFVSGYLVSRWLPTLSFYGS